MKRILMPASLFAGWLFLAGCSDSPKVEVQPNERGVRVMRFSSNQPSIQASRNVGTDPDLALYEEQGFQQASDRLFQMDVLRRIARGKLAALVGEKAYERDVSAIAVGLPIAVENSAARLKAEYPKEWAYLQAYSDGVNRFISEIPTRRPDMAKLYAFVTKDTNYQIEAWEPIDSVGVSENLSFHLSSSFQEKVAFGTLAIDYLRVTINDDQSEKSLFGKGELADLFDTRPLEPEVILQSPEKQFPARVSTKLPKGKAPKTVMTTVQPSQPKGLLRRVFGQPNCVPASGTKACPPPRRMKFEFPCLKRLFPFPGCSRRTSFGSNSFVVAPSFTGNGKGYLANDTHLALSYPSIPYELALDSIPAGGTIRARGQGVAGFPGILIGHTDSVAWGMTNLGADVDDLYLEKLHPSDGTYQYDGQWLPVTSRDFEVVVRKSFGKTEKRILKLRFTHHGPIASDHFPELAEKLSFFDTKGFGPFAATKAAMSYKWIGHSGTLEFAALSRMNRAKNIQEFQEAVKLMEAGAQNIVFADNQGNIGYVAQGKFPIREYINSVFPLPYVPVFGNGTHEWKGFRSDIPAEINPPSGRIVTANNDPMGHSLLKNLSNFKDYFGLGFATGARARRMVELLDANRGHLDREGIAAIQMDHKDLVASRFIGLLREAGTDLSKGLSPSASAILTSLLKWDSEGAMAKRQLREPVLFDAFLERVMQGTFAEFRKVAPETFDQLRRGIVAIKTTYHHIHDDLNPTPDASKELRQAAKDRALGILRAALEGTDALLAERGHENLSWGQINRLQFANALDGIIPSLLNFPVERDGSFDTVDVSGEHDGKSLGPNFRMILVIEPGKPITGFNAIPGGNWAPIYRPQLQKEILDWRDGKQHEIVPFL